MRCCHSIQWSVGDGQMLNLALIAGVPVIWALLGALWLAARAWQPESPRSQVRTSSRQNPLR
jgi:hypothetical protein